VEAHTTTKIYELSFTLWTLSTTYELRSNETWPTQRDRVSSVETPVQFFAVCGPKFTVTTVRSEIRSWANKEHLKHWQATPACRQAKSLIHGPDRQLTRSALGLRRREFKVLVGLLTGHTTLNRHLCVMKLRKDPLCSACGEEEETVFHF